MEAKKELSVRFAVEKLDAVSAHASATSTQLACKIGMTALRQRLVDDEKVVAAGMRFDKGNHVLLFCLTTLREADNYYFVG